MNKPKSRTERKGPGLLLISVGTMLSSTVVAGFLLGYWVDGWLETPPIFMILFGGMGLVGGFLKVYKLMTDPKLQ
ncbi:MAG: AtpZ/AtpI family protein [Ectothiorhodospiraceae bacterium]|nr:AtpZ/AtpI family protein [Ectothiorhodospiraceae bacterium]